MAMQDTALLKTYLKFGTVLGIISFLPRNSIKRKSLLFNVYVLFLFFVFSIVSVVFFCGKLRCLYKSMSMTEKIIDSLEMFMESGFMMSALLGAIFFKQSWKVTLENIIKIDSKLEPKVPKVSVVYCLKGPVYFLIFFPCEIYEILLWENTKNGIEGYYATYRITKFYGLFVLVLISEIVIFLTRRYHYLDDLIKDTFAMANNHDIRCVKANLKKVRALCVLLSNITQEISDIFGKQIIFIFVIITIDVSSLYNWFAIVFDKNISEVTKVEVVINSAILNPSTYIIVITITVLNCDTLEKAGQDIVKTCYMLQEHIDMEQSVLRGELILLSNFLRELAPKISACGYFFVNKKLLASLLSAVTSYIIIIIQFRNN